MRTMERWNPEGITRSDLMWVLQRPDIILDRRKKGTCLLCSGRPINDAAMCDACMTLLSREELRLVEFWMMGALPD